MTSIVAILVVVSATTPALSLDEAVEAALAVHPALSADRADRAAADANRLAARTAFFPSLAVRGGYARVKEREPLAFAGTTFGDPVHDAASVGVELSQPIFTGHRIRSAVDLATIAVGTRDDLIVKTRRDLVQDVRGAYWTLVEANERVSAIDDRLRQVAAALEDTRNRVDAGVVTRTVLLEVEMRYAEAELQVLRAQNSRSIARARLASLIGADQQAIGEPTTALPEAPTAATPPVDELVETALVQRADVALRQRSVSRAEVQRTAEQASRYPQLFMTGAFTVARPAPDLFPADDTYGTTWNVGLVGRYELGDQLRTSRAIAAAEETIGAERERLRAVEEAIALEVRIAHAGWRTAVEEIRVAATIARRAAENLTDTRARVANGTALRTDQLDAEAVVLESRLAVTSARVAERHAWESLRRAVGAFE